MFIGMEVILFCRFIFSTTLCKKIHIYYFTCQCANYECMSWTTAIHLPTGMIVPAHIKSNSYFCMYFSSFLFFKFMPAAIFHTNWSNTFSSNGFSIFLSVTSRMIVLRKFSMQWSLLLDVPFGKFMADNIASALKPDPPMNCIPNTQQSRHWGAHP